MKKLFIAVAAMFMFATPSFALTLGEVWDELGTGDYYCSGSSCSREDEDTITTQLPDTVISEGEGSTNNDGISRTCFTGSLLDGPFKNGEQCFVPKSLVPTTGGYSIPNGSVTTTTCTITIKTISDPYHSGTGEWEIDTSSSTYEGGC